MKHTTDEIFVQLSTGEESMNLDITTQAIASHNKLDLTKFNVYFFSTISKKRGHIFNNICDPHKVVKHHPNSSSLPYPFVVKYRDLNENDIDGINLFFRKPNGTLTVDRFSHSHFADFISEDPKYHCGQLVDIFNKYVVNEANDDFDVVQEPVYCYPHSAVPKTVMNFFTTNEHTTLPQLWKINKPAYTALFSSPPPLAEKRALISENKEILFNNDRIKFILKNAIDDSDYGKKTPKVINTLIFSFIEPNQNVDVEHVFFPSFRT